MRSLAITICLLFGLASTAAANVAKDERGWFCGTSEDWELASLRAGSKVVMNNFFYEEKSSAATNMTVLAIKYSVINRSGAKYRMSSQFVGYDKAGMVTFAISVSPVFQLVTEGASTSANDIYVDGPVLAGTAKICTAFAAQSM
ncbi:MAG: hypothetical protein OXI22_20635 [Defluviicoccus sp.]|nr:hypothetical protein [Defluviicoccus sp.]